MKTTSIDNDYHPDDQLENDADHGHWGTKLADVTPGPTGGSGPTAAAAAYATGALNDPKVKSIGMDTLKAWRARALERNSK